MRRCCASALVCPQARALFVAACATARILQRPISSPGLAPGPARARRGCASGVGSIDVGQLVRDLGAASRELALARREAALAAARLSELRLAVERARQAQGIIDARGALEYVLGLHHATSSAGLVRFFWTDDLGAFVLACVNQSRKVMGDNGDRAHTPTTLAALVLALKKRLNEGSHDWRAPEERAKAAAAPLVVPPSLSVSERTVLTCLLEAAGYVFEKAVAEVEVEDEG